MIKCHIFKEEKGLAPVPLKKPQVLQQNDYNTRRIADYNLRLVRSSLIRSSNLQDTTYQTTEQDELHKLFLTIVLTAKEHNFSGLDHLKALTISDQHQAIGPGLLP
jgi:hypothetical protein